jgi:hypothetical protein
MKTERMQFYSRTAAPLLFAYARAQMAGGPIRKAGERGRNRTYNLLIKSQLLCQLSYAPTVGNLAGRTNENYSIPNPIFAGQLSKSVRVEFFH